MSYGNIYSTGGSAEKIMPELLAEKKEINMHFMVIQNLRTGEVEVEKWEFLKSVGCLVHRNTGPCDAFNNPAIDIWEIIETFTRSVQIRARK